MLNVHNSRLLSSYYCEGYLFCPHSQLASLRFPVSPYAFSGVPQASYNPFNLSCLTIMVQFQER